MDYKHLRQFGAVVADIEVKIARELDDWDLALETPMPLDDEERKEIERRRESFQQQMADINFLVQTKLAKIDKMKGYFGKLESGVYWPVNSEQQAEVHALQNRIEPMIGNLYSDIASLRRAKKSLRDKYWAKLYEDKYRWSLGLPVTSTTMCDDKEFISYTQADSSRAVDEGIKAPPEVPKTRKEWTPPVPTPQNPVFETPAQKWKRKNDKTPNTPKRTVCSCKKSKCLKLYCDCFAGNLFCSELCSCADCRNDKVHKYERKLAIDLLKERKPAAYERMETPGSSAHAAAQEAGCKCKRTRCLKKYCVCFNQQAYCTDACVCLECGNNPNKPPPAAAADTQPCAADSTVDTQATSDPTKRKSGELSPLDMLYEASKQDQPDTEGSTKRVRLVA
uniref:CRC domain-containing protein n=1 Tax=Mucochytrium quahogii TaxID=96639 RepID=A0A7S2S456_9STRA|mmetsp:Transcript_4759/g.7163  ORF Transcript_4759/g.7163 Transcript_4759/m.7163 type:complete len:393 (-) Transcript_4759:141-1319(-)|eukprot:CAMPEP_0203764566 /NCGR_PEP_ID=MMETSP0098-20131031/17842_1 /ASSEMBLY_ACC=CAM_ASM_000208 /TAXON_ID=96639 /ORGANISM=" , Strain NY0313808BC1" /LENGTH=392 /DNA_ID=CAMNT_0050660587 /DNA_START=446 /DNA_END=1624 /DNA_ORIENTATION=-